MKRQIGVAAVVLLTAWCWVRGEARSSRPEVEAVQDWAQAREGAATLELRTRAGNIQVVGSDGDQLQFHAVKKVRADGDEARAFLDRMTIDRRREGDHWVVKADWPDPRPRQVQSASVSFEIRLPRRMGLAAVSGAGNVEATGIGETRIQTGAGNVSVRDLGGALNSHTGAGNVTARGVSGRVEVHTGAGNIEVDGSDGALDVETGAGNIGLRRVQTAVKAGTGAGNIEAEVARAGAASLDMGTGVGNVTLRLPRDTSALLEAHTGQGQVEMQPATGSRLSNGRKQLEATLGEGRGSIRLHTGIGNVQIRLAAGG
jgi:DUF4097 and DUF4098 domain-containing protein YvlB